MNLKKIRPTTWEMLLCVWENFTGIQDRKAARFWRLASWALLALGTIFALASTFHLRDYLEAKVFTPSLPQAALGTDKARLQSLSGELRLALQQRAHSALWVQTMRERGRNLFAPPPSPQPPAPELSGLEVSPPPEIVVKAVMKSKDSWAIVVDIAGAGSGLILRPGDSFMEGRGKVVRMEGDRLIVRWDGREWTAVPGLF